MRVLVVEDLVDLRELLEGIVLGALPPGSSVVGRGTLATALAALDDGPFDLILLDLGLPDSPDIGTYDVIAERAEASDTPILVVTGLSDSAVMDGLLLRGAVVLYKPVTRFDLGGMVRCLTCQHRPRAEDIFAQLRQGVAQLARAVDPHGARA